MSHYRRPFVPCPSAIAKASGDPRMYSQADRSIPMANPFAPVGVLGTAIYGGYIVSREVNENLNGILKWKTLHDMVYNVSVVGSGIRYYLDLLRRPEWTWEPCVSGKPAPDSAAAREVADLVTDVLEDMRTPWSRVVRMLGMSRYEGFRIATWKAKRRADGTIGIDDVRRRVSRSIRRWLVDAEGNVLGVWQESPQDGKEYPIPRGRMIYLVDDEVTDSPDGMGILRQAVDVVTRLRALERLEGIMYETELRGVPVIRAPLSLIKGSNLPDEDKAALISELETFQGAHVRAPGTGLLIDSLTYKGENGNPSNVYQYSVELLRGEGASFEPLRNRIKDLHAEVGRLFTAEMLLLGSQGSGDSTLAKEKMLAVIQSVGGTARDVGFAARRDLAEPIVLLNGADMDLLPRPKVSTLALRDVTEVAIMLRDLGAAGAAIRPGDPVVNQIRNVAELVEEPEWEEDMLEDARRSAAGIVPPPSPGDDVDEEEDVLIGENDS